MKVLVIGSGGREHTLVWKIAQSRLVDKIFCAPGNGGISKIAECVDIKAEDIESLLDFAKKESIDLTVVGPEAPLAEGIVDGFNRKNLKIFGPTKEQALLESSKVFAKQFMKRYDIPTANFEIFDDKDKAIEFVKSKGKDIVVKADGLAGGKGVSVCKNLSEAEDAIKQIMVEKKFGTSGDRIVIEDRLIGEEASMIVLCDSRNILPLASSQDHKRIYDGDKGANTGGMGAYSPAPILEGEMFNRTIEEVINPLVKGIQSEMQTYRGVLYVGLMITNKGPYVLEFNVRFGDPEIQAIAPRLKSDLVDALEATIEGRLNEITLDWDKRACVCVVCASGGYPGKYEKGKVIQGLDKLENLENVIVFHAGTKVQKPETRNPALPAGRQKPEKNIYVTNGGRVLGVTALGDTAKKAIDNVYDAISFIHFDEMHYRKDIGYRALKRQEAMQ